MDAFLLLALFVVSVLVTLSSLDDLLVDFLACGIVREHFFLQRRNPGARTPATGIFVANWREEDVLAAMVEGNVARIGNPEIKLFLGVYPNDAATREIAEALAAKHPNRVTTIVNCLSGPTSKGQMLNEMFRQVFGRADAPELIVLHDSEDVIDPRSFEVYASYAKEYDFIQIPVFSFESTRRSLVAATYMDEFAERHTRELVVRDAVGAAIPSAGVGTCLSRRLIEHFLRTRGHVLIVGCVTEDYILGVEAKRAGFRAAFAAISRTSGREIDFVATREFFPRGFWAAVRQKTRWVFGTDFEALNKLGWKGDIWDRYFFLRDRKGMLTNFLPPMAFLLLVLIVAGAVDLDEMPQEVEPLFSASIAMNLWAAGVRYVVRMAAVKKVYGRYDPLGVASRWPVAALVNALAALRAWKIYLVESKFASRPIAWAKTQHELPQHFAASQEQAEL